MTTVINTFTSEETLPLLYKYGGQINNQPAYISLNCDTGEVNADYSSVIGGGCSWDEFHGILLTFRINPYMTTDQITEVINENLESFQKIVDGYEKAWDGNNYVGKYSDEANELIESLRESLDQPVSVMVIETIEELLEGGDYYPEENVSIEEFAKELIDDTNGEYIIVDGIKNNLVESLEEFWIELVEGGDDLPKHVAQYLINNNKIDSDHMWYEDIVEMAE